MVRARQGQIARVDLGTGICRLEPTPDQLRRQWLGGRGLGVALLQDSSALDPADPANPFVIAPGTLCGSDTPMADRCLITARSPLTGGIFSSSSGGWFARHLHGTGLDALVVTGVSPAPVSIKVTVDGLSVNCAKKQWGSGVSELFVTAGPSGAMAAIGPAGEQGCLFASLETSGGEPFARGGFGALLGQRGLKLITVCGDLAVPVVDQPAFDKARQDLMRLFLASPFLYGPFGIRQHGTLALVDLLAQRGMLPGPNFGPYVSDAAACNAAALRQQFTADPSGCGDCPVACKRRLADGRLLPDYDGLTAFTALCGITDLQQAVTACQICSDLGMDPVSAAGSLAAWAEITGTVLSGVDLKALLNDIAWQRGDGTLIASGARRLAEQLGRPDAAMTVKGLELPPYDPRAACGLALAYAVAPHGGTHLDAWPLAPEILRKPVPVDPASFDGKARVIAMAEEANAAVDSLGLCRFVSCAAELEECAALLSAVTGDHYSAADLLAIGRRIILAERAFNQACGIDLTADRLPDRFFTSGNGLLPPLDREQFQQELQRYQRVRASQS